MTARFTLFECRSSQATCLFELLVPFIGQIECKRECEGLILFLPKVSNKNLEREDQEVGHLLVMPVHSLPSSAPGSIRNYLSPSLHKRIPVPPGSQAPSEDSKNEVKNAASLRSGMAGWEPKEIPCQRED